MTKQEFFHRLNQGEYITPASADMVTWYYEWLLSPTRHTLPLLAGLEEKKELAAQVMNKRLKITEFFQNNASHGKTKFTVFYKDSQLIFIGINTCLTVKI